MSGGAAAARAVLLVRLGARRCALPLSSVGETMRPLPLETLPDAPPFVLGLSRVRGEAVPVVDGGALFGRRSAEVPTRYVTLRFGVRRAMLAVDSVDGVRRVDPSVFEPLPALAGVMAGELVEAVAALDEGLLYLLREASLVPDEVWASLEPGV